MLEASIVLLSNGSLRAEEDVQRKTMSRAGGQVRKNSPSRASSTHRNSLRVTRG